MNAAQLAELERRAEHDPEASPAALKRLGEHIEAARRQGSQR
ncbi:hypothetical protein [Polymorphospora lycopeni]|uniref:Uncharacterized protein n=1 Tax=Polymorphospora lycopeni TaxID=3140240 RepID=A0ABV5CL17_9ACTN